MQETTILTLPEVAQLLRVSQWTIRRRMLEDGLPFVQLAKWSSITFDKDTVLRWWLEHQHPKPAEVRAREIKALRKRGGAHAR